MARERLAATEAAAAKWAAVSNPAPKASDRAASEFWRRPLAQALQECNAKPSPSIKVPGAKGAIGLNQCYRGREHLSCVVAALLAFAGMRTARSEALVIISAPDFFRDAALLSRLALEAGLPTVCEWASMARDGCLIGYGPNFAALWRRPADYVAQILRGAKPGSCRSSNQRYSSLLLTSKPPRRSASLFRSQPCSAPTRCSSKCSEASCHSSG